MKTGAMLVAGVMSGTSGDGIDVALVRITPGKVRPSLTLEAHEAFPYPAALRRAVLETMNSERTSTAELARLNWRLGLAYAEAVKATTARHKSTADLVGCHGQTLYHQARTAQYAGRSFACTWQAGEMAMLAASVNAPVVSNFRPADMTAGGEGAPLVPLLDYVLFADAKRGRVLQNIGGIANLTAIPAGSKPEELIAFDTGPGNMVIDALAEKLFGRKYDRNGLAAAKGRVLEPVMNAMMRNKYFTRKPPKSAGREQFGAEYAAILAFECSKRSRRPEDALATATALTAESIARGYEQYVHGAMGVCPVDYVISGGGAKNATLVKMLAKALQPFHCTIKTSADFGLPAEAKEAVAFALLAWQTIHRQPGNLPAATGAKKAVVLGQVTYAP